MRIGPAKTPSPESAPQLREASPRLPVSSTLPSVPMARGLDIDSDSAADHRLMGRRTGVMDPQRYRSRRDRGRDDEDPLHPMPGHGYPFCHGDTPVQPRAIAARAHHSRPSEPIIPPMSVRVTSTIEPVSASVAQRLDAMERRRGRGCGLSRPDRRGQRRGRNHAEHQRRPT